MRNNESIQMFNKKYTKIFSAALFVCWIYISMSSGNNFELKWNIKNCIKSKLTLFSSFLSFLNMGKIKKVEEEWNEIKKILFFHQIIDFFFISLLPMLLFLLRLEHDDQFVCCSLILVTSYDLEMFLPTQY